MKVPKIVVILFPIVTLALVIALLSMQQSSTPAPPVEDSALLSPEQKAVEGVPPVDESAQMESKASPAGGANEGWSPQEPAPAAIVTKTEVKQKRAPEPPRKPAPPAPRVEEQQSSPVVEQDQEGEVAPADEPDTDLVFGDEPADRRDRPSVVVPPPPPRRGEEPRSGDEFEAIQTATPVANVPPARRYVIPEGTVLDIRLEEDISTEYNKAGDRFLASLDSDLVAEGEVIAPKGSLVRGRLVEVAEPGKVKGRAAMSFQLEEMVIGDREYSIKTNEITMEANSSKAKDAKTVGVATAVGAALGAIFGGKKGAAVGAASGAGASTAGVLLSRGDHVELSKEQFFSFRLEETIELYQQP